jgi:hypothetical protein
MRLMTANTATKKRMVAMATMAERSRNGSEVSPPL